MTIGTMDNVIEMRASKRRLGFRTMYRLRKEGGGGAPGRLGSPPEAPPTYVRNEGGSLPPPGKNISPAELADKQAQIYRDGFAPGIPQEELDALNARICGEGRGPSEPVPEAPQVVSQTTSDEGEKNNTVTAGSDDGRRSYDESRRRLSAPDASDAELEGTANVLALLTPRRAAACIAALSHDEKT